MDTQQGQCKTLHLSESEINRYKNIYAIQELIPMVFRTVLQWGTKDKPNDVPFLSYIQNHKDTTVTQLRKKYKFINRNIDIIKAETDVHNFDVSLLFPLIQVCCPGISDFDDSVWEEEDESKIEVLLRLLKDHRNFVVHGREATSSDTFTLITRRLDALIQISGQLFLPEDPSEIEQRRLELFHMMSRMFPPNQENIKIMRQKEFRISAWNEGKNYWTSSSNGRFLKQNRQGASLAKWYFPLDLTVMSHSQNRSAFGSTKSSEQLLEEWFVNDEARVTVVEGEAGAGKTTLADKVAYSFYEPHGMFNELLKKYHLLHYFSCREQVKTTLYDFMKLQYPRTCNRFNREDVESFFFYASNLILVDGYDEVNDTSSYTFKELLENFEATSGGHMIITTRPHKTKALEQLLLSSGLSYRVSKLNEITNPRSQIKFLEKLEYHYGRISYEQCPPLGIVDKFNDLNVNCKTFFTTPFTLETFASICSSHSMNTERNDSKDFLHLILNEYQRLLRSNFEGKGIKNIDFLVQDIFGVFGKFAFDCLKNNMLIVTESILQSLSFSLKQILEKYNCIHLVDAKQVESTFLRRRSLPYPNYRESYHFPHKIVMEFLAAKALCKSMMEGDVTLPNEMAQSIRSDQQRFLGVLKFAVIDLHRKFGNSFFVSRTFDRLKEYIKVASPGFCFWADLVTSCNNSDEIAQASQVDEEDIEYEMQSQDVTWKVTDSRLALAATKIMSYWKPTTLIVDFSIHDDVPVSVRSLLASVREHFRGNLYLKFRRNKALCIPMSDFLRELEGAECTLIRFTGCIASCADAAILIPLLKGRRYSTATLSVGAPSVFSHELHWLSGSPQFIYITIDYSVLRNAMTRPLKRRPLPPRIRIVFAGVPATNDAANIIVETLVALEPSNATEKYWEIHLHRCSMTDEQLHQLLLMCYNKGIRTPLGRPTEFIIHESFPECRYCVYPHSAGDRNVEIVVQDF